MEVKAITRFVRVAPLKARLVADQIRGKHVGDALNIVRFGSDRAASLVEKTLQSALANAHGKEGIDIDKLTVSGIWVDGGPFWKRFRPRAMGRATRIRKRLSHITVVLSDGK